jgi:hypothetical protein
MAVKFSFAAFVVSLAALLLVAFGVIAPAAHVTPVQEAPASYASAPASAGQSGVLYVANHGAWG